MIESTSPRSCDRFDASTSEPVILSATSFELATWACGSAVWISCFTCETSLPLSARTSTTFASPFWFASVCNCCKRQIDVGALAAERRADETDDENVVPFRFSVEPTFSQCFAA